MKKIFGLAALALAVGFASCSKDNTMTTGEPESSTVMAFTFNKPQGSFVTYADIASNEEWFIKDVDVYVAIGGTVEKLDLGATGDYTIAEDAKSYTVTMSPTWVKDNLGASANFYFVGNDAISTEGPHAALSLAANLADEAKFKNVLADELKDSGNGKYKLIVAPNGTTTGLLFSAYLEDVKIEGKVNKSTTLYRREARFDVENPMYENDAYEVKEILVSQASTSGLIFGSGDPAAVTINKKSLVSIAGFKAGAYDAASKLAASRFYLYPTEMSSTAGDGKTEITFMVSIGGADPVAFPVDGSAVNYKIEANTRYILELDIIKESVGIRIADYDDAEESLPATPGEDDAFSATNFVNTGDGAWDGATNVYTFTATTTNTLAFDVVTKFGTEAKVDYVFGDQGDLTADISGLTPVTTTTYAGYTTTDKYTIAVPAAATDGFSIRLTISSKNGEGKEVILFQKGNIDVTTEFNDPKLAEAIKDAVNLLPGGDPNNITAKDLEDITTLNVSGTDGASSLEGIENLPNLTIINAEGNTNLTGSLDLSGNPELTEINLKDTGITEIDLSGNTALTDLNLRGTKISEIDLSGNPNLIKVDLNNLSNVTEVDFTNNPNIKSLEVSGVNLESVDISTLEVLENLSMTAHAMTSLDLSNNRNLKTLGLTGSFTTLDLSNMPELNSFILGHSRGAMGDLLTTLDFSHNRKLKSLYSISESVTNIIFAGEYNAFTSIYTSGMKSLTTITGFQNLTKLTNCDLLNSPDLVLVIDYSNHPALLPFNASGSPSVSGINKP